MLINLKNKILKFSFKYSKEKKDYILKILDNYDKSKQFQK